MPTNNEEVKISFNKDEALVLFEFVSRLNNMNSQNLFQDQAEEKMLWLIEAQLGKSLFEPFMPDYMNRVKAARNKIRDND